MTLFPILNAACLIAGTTVGGGFLALPAVVAPSGFFPSASALIGVWAYFWLQSMVVVECLLRTRRQSDETSTSAGIAATARFAFGPIGESFTVALLVLLVEATLVSQLSRAGSLLFRDQYRFGVAATALSMAALVFGSKNNKIIANLNSALTAIFVAMAVSLFASGAPAADWSHLSLGSNWNHLPTAIPTFLQLLVYCEILPTICQFLDYNLLHVRWAITLDRKSVV